MEIPTLNKMTKVYRESALIEQMKCGRPSEGTIRNTLSGVRLFVNWLNERRESQGLNCLALDDDFPLVSIIKPSLVRSYLSDMLKRNVKPVTALSYVYQLQQLFARWVRPYYEDRGWKIPQFPSIGGRPATPRYKRPAPELISAVKNWYDNLSTFVNNKDETCKRCFAGRHRNVPGYDVWFAATMMLEFAMRNSDIMRLSNENFICREGRMFLNYIPNKTKNSSGRMVKWPIHPDIWSNIRIPLQGLDEEVFDALNREMRALGFKGTKGAYELRKICIDHVYQRFGVEMATSISGDNIRTIMHYYADPTQPNIGEIRITDLL